MFEDTLRLAIPNRIAPKCLHCEDTHTCQKCLGPGDLAGWMGIVYECDACNGEGMCPECCCRACTEVGQVPCRCDEDDE